MPSSRLAVWPPLIALYLLAVAALLLPWPFGAHPPWAYNWEGYTAWRWQSYWEPPAGPLVEIWVPTDGLMTDSGQGPLVGLPVAIGVALGGFNVSAMRLPVALLAAVSVPLLWLLGRRIAGPGPAALAAVLLATAPAFLFYGRTATLVGISLVPLLLTALALARVVDAPQGAGWSWRREGALAAALLLGIYAYALVRLLWPLAIALLILAALRPGTAARRHVLLATALLCLVIVPAAVMALDILTAAHPDPVAAAAGYFHARGEQLVEMRTDPGAVGQYLRDPISAETAGWETVWRLVTQNAADLAALLVDRETRPIPTDFWNEHGRLWPWFFLPFALAGTFTAVRRWWHEGTVVPILPLVLALGMALPLLLTSRVHVGRLLPALPFALLLVAAGAAVISGWLTSLARRVSARAIAPAVAPLVSLAILVPATLGAHIDMETPIGPTREARTAEALAAWRDEVNERGGAVLVEDPALGDEIEGVHAATYRLDLDTIYRFVELRDEEAIQSADARPALFWRGALEALAADEIARPCQRFWFVAPEIADDFLSAWRAVGCSGAPDSVILP